MVDMNKVSGAVQKAVAEIAKMDGKKGISSQTEFDKLGELLANTTGGANQEYIREEMNKAQANRLSEQVSDFVKKAIKSIAKSMGNKKTIDTETEALQLASMLGNIKGEYSEEDLAYIKEVLIASGYESLIPGQGEDNNNNVVDKDVEHGTKGINIKPVLPDEEKKVNPNEGEEVIPDPPNNTKPNDEDIQVPDTPNEQVPDTSTKPKNPEKDTSKDNNVKPPTVDTPKSNSEVNPEQVKAISNQIFDAVDGAGTKDEQLDAAIDGINKDNVIEVLNEYNSQHPNMFEAIFDDLSGFKFKKTAQHLRDTLVARAGTKNCDISDVLEKFNKELLRPNSDKALLAKYLGEIANRIQE